jgi:hypothetical protein
VPMFKCGLLLVNFSLAMSFPSYLFLNVLFMVYLDRSFSASSFGTSS